MQDLSRGVLAACAELGELSAYGAGGYVDLLVVNGERDARYAGCVKADGATGLLGAAGGGDGTPSGEAADAVDAYPRAWGVAECFAECEAYWGCGGVVEDAIGADCSGTVQLGSMWYI
ncbi:hypothetical protein V6Z93_009628 [Aspergillus fumigatus]